MVVSARRGGGVLDVIVSDDGHGLPDGFDLESSGGLGLQIVRTLLDSELDSALQIRAGADGGTEAVMRLSLRGR